MDGILNQVLFFPENLNVTVLLLYLQEFSVMNYISRKRTGNRKCTFVFTSLNKMLQDLVQKQTQKNYRHIIYHVWCADERIKLVFIFLQHFVFDILQLVLRHSTARVNHSLPVLWRTSCLRTNCFRLKPELSVSQQRVNASAPLPAIKPVSTRLTNISHIPP